MKKLLIVTLILATVYACSNNAGEASKTNESNDASGQAAAENPSYDPERGSGKFSNVQLSASLDKQKAEAGSKIFDVKCASCHKLTDERLVGPGWKGVTQRHKPEWILNFITNVDEMLDKDPKAQAQLEICLVRMPNQNLTDDDAYAILEFMRKNDGVQ